MDIPESSAILASAQKIELKCENTTILGTDPFQDANEMQFSSMPFHNLSGLSLYPFRAYNPNLQRWLTRDPIQEAGGINLYRAMNNDPVDWIDPLGLAQGYGNPVQAFGVPIGPSSPYASGGGYYPNGVFYSPSYGPDISETIKSAAEFINNTITDPNLWDALAMESDGTSKLLEPGAFAVGAMALKLGDDAVQAARLARVAKDCPKFSLELTQWGWVRSPSWNRAAKLVGSAGHKATLMDLAGKVPTQSEAVAMIESQGGTLLRIESHPPGGISAHTFPHINYVTSSGNYATIRIQ